MKNVLTIARGAASEARYAASGDWQLRANALTAPHRVRYINRRFEVQSPKNALIFVSGERAAEGD